MKVLIEIEDESATEDLIDIQRDYAIDYKVLSDMTNGEVIKALFPNCEQKEHIYNGYFEMYFNNDLKDASYMRASKDFWDAKYKNEVKEWES